MSRFLLDWARNRRTLILAAFYASICAASFYLAYEVRWDFAVSGPYQVQRLHYISIIVGVKIVALVLVRQLGSMLTYFSIPDLIRMSWAMLGSTTVLFIPRWTGLSYYSPPRGVLLIDFLLCMMGLCVVRLGTRMYRERISVGQKIVSEPLQLVAIVGAGDAGASLAKEFLNYPARGFRPVVFFDDDPGKHGKLIHGVPVVGRPEAIGEVKEAAGVVKIVIAMPSAPSRRIRDVVMLMKERGLKVETLPSVEELASGRVTVNRIRPVEVQDLLGRETVNLDSASIRRLAEGRVVMVTGAGGSIGSELCRQIAALNPKRLLMVEQSEASLFVIEQELNETGLGAIALPLVADILDTGRMEFIFGRFKPQVIFHAAAHKHVYLMERQPGEAIHNNAIGTRGLAELSVQHAVETFVFISTDKAINPTSVMGATKRLAELQIMAAGQNAAAHTRFMAVRFGNVLGSSGSVVPIFKRQIANGGPITVTHPDVTRYFMTIPEAVGLVLQSSVMGQGGEIFVLDMGQPVKIVDLARQMIELSGLKPGEDIEIKFTGLKPGEKLFEELQHRSEKLVATDHPRVWRFISDAPLNADLGDIAARLHRAEPNELKTALQQFVPEYTPHFD